MKRLEKRYRATKSTKTMKEKAWTQGQAKGKEKKGHVFKGRAQAEKRTRGEYKRKGAMRWILGGTRESNERAEGE